MSKSRDDLCKQSIDIFMSNNYDIEYNICTLTENKSSSMHLYNIIMPRLVKLYEVDTSHTINGRSYPPGTVFHEQDLPTSAAFTAYFNNYYEDYALYRKENRVSYQEVTLVNIETDKLVASVVVKYAKQHKPYPIERVEPINFENRYKNLKQLYEEQCSNITILENDNYYYKRRLRIAKQELVTAQNSFINKYINVKQKFLTLQHIIRTLYTKTDQSDECPVCYENILAENLIIPECGHFICSVCSNKCSCCPLCRDNGI
jgi:hypothetical protein